MRIFSTWLPRLTYVTLGAFTLTYLVVALVRIAYPFDLDYIEDDILIEAWRFAQGLPVFIAPNADFVPHAYTPLYMLLSAGLFKIVGVSYLPMRALSFAVTLLTGGLLWWAGYALSRRCAVALLAPLLFFAGYALTGEEYELARVDALFIMLVVAGILLGIAGVHSQRRIVCTAICLALAFFVKQTAVLFILGMILYLFIAQRSRLWTFVTVTALTLLPPLWWMDWASGGWSTTYLFIIPQTDPIVLSRIGAYLRSDLARHLGPLVALCLVAPLLQWRGYLNAHPLVRTWPWFALLALVDSGWMRARLGGNVNSLMPAYTLICLMPAIVLSAPPIAGRPWARVAVYSAVLAQCVLALYNPWAALPTAAMTRSGEQLITRIAQTNGSVWVWEHPYYALLAGKAPGVSLTALWHARAHGASPLPPDLVQRIQQQVYAAIITDEGEYAEVEADVDTAMTDAYHTALPLGEMDAPPTLSGAVVRPAHIYLRP